MLAMLGWNNGTEQELFSLNELADSFGLTRVHKGSAKFDYEKARWFNQEWIKKTTAEKLMPLVKPFLAAAGIEAEDQLFLKKVIDLVKERCVLLTDFTEQAGFFFKAPVNPDVSIIKSKWAVEKKDFFQHFCLRLQSLSDWTLENIESSFKELAEARSIKPGELQLPMRIMLVGGKFGPAVFEIVYLIGKEEAGRRIESALSLLNE
jgi:glutamyl-tRNA synthetase